MGKLVSHKYDGALLSFGAGVNSTALAILLINEGWRGPIVFADTGCEWPETYCFMDYFEAEWLRPRGLEITRVGTEWRIPSKQGSLIEYCEAHNVIPLAGTRWCTIDYKVKPVGRWATKHGIEVQLIGIAADEAHRRPEGVRPLVEYGITRKGCIDIIQAEALEVPQKSGCYLCPFQRDSQWRDLWRLHPEFFEGVARLEEQVERKRPGYYRATLDPSGKVTLRERQFRYETQQSFLEEDDWDYLLAYKPCICGL